MKIVILLAAGVVGTVPLMAHGADCALQPGRIDRLLCSETDLMRARQDAGLRLGALASWSIAPRGWRQAQIRWETEVRDRCEDVECLRGVYGQRNALLHVLHETPTPIAQGHWTPLLAPLVIESVDDTVVVRLPALTLKEEALVQVEWQVPAEDRARWSVAGPNVRLLCVPPDAREGYAPRFSYRQATQGSQWPRLQRGEHMPSFALFAFVAGRDVPLNEPVRCSILIGETLVDRPSVMTIWQEGVAAPER